MRSCREFTDFFWSICAAHGLYRDLWLQRTEWIGSKTIIKGPDIHLVATTHLSPSMTTMIRTSFIRTVAPALRLKASPLTLSTTRGALFATTGHRLLSTSSPLSKDGDLLVNKRTHKEATSPHKRGHPHFWVPFSPIEPWFYPQPPMHRWLHTMQLARCPSRSVETGFYSTLCIPQRNSKLSRSTSFPTVVASSTDECCGNRNFRLCIVKERTWETSSPTD